MSAWLTTLFPFLRWFPMSREVIRADLIAGITVALVLVPQSMAYAQLAGLPVVYGLYASFVPVIVASLWGSSSQLHTGPVAMLSLMSAAALIPLASPGSAEFIELSVMLALMVGILRLALGLFRLGAIVNLLSSPVIVGFTNAAALIIGLSQLSKVIGVPFPRTESYLADLWRVIEQLPYLHLETVLFAAGAFLLIYGLKRKLPSLPGVLIAVAVTTLISALVSYENKMQVTQAQIQSEKVVSAMTDFARAKQLINKLTEEISSLNQQAGKLEEQAGLENIEQAAELRATAAVRKHELNILKKEQTLKRVALHKMTLQGVQTPAGQWQFYPEEAVPDNRESDEKSWRFDSIEDGQIVLSSGGAVVGTIPEGLPDFNVPTLQWDLMLALLPAALVMALIGFMEATSISKAIASTTGERVDTSKELVGQGLANIAGSFFSSYTVSGSFSRSAVAARTGARTGMFAIISAVAVVLVLLFFTTYLYHLPQAVLAVIVMMAVFSLIRIRPLIQAWRVDRVSAGIGVVTFLATLLMAPAIANGILLGISLTVLHYLIRIMRPRAEIVSHKEDGSLGGIKAHHLKPISELYVPVRFDGSLTFINVAYFEDIVLEALSEFPRAKVILVIGSSINEIDASGEEKVREVARRLRDSGVQLMFSGLKHQVMQVMESSGLMDELGREAFFADKQTALQTLKNLFEKRVIEPRDSDDRTVYRGGNVTSHLL
ncbi:SulP family inorganic anion transporter [Thiohalophilus thiocyanatoxydans]|uniref:STAS domain-containing protein n=1 Tax=Thiohalophilus thiocyanatoxydans TaxID=381308 RepID=A0A4V3H4Q0_9GAMM|nr:SulP family inorganic anion transporter [Thiohalophilus thiocyanatoxydans]TDY04035.1 STAS domain-containing protein [Thiohalophilus thiocyanatoxydans]